MAKVNIPHPSSETLKCVAYVLQRVLWLYFRLTAFTSYPIQSYLLNEEFKDLINWKILENLKS